MSKNVVVGVTGGIAAYKSVMLVSMLKKLGVNVDVIMTKNAQEFVAPLSFETISQNPVTTDTFRHERNWEIEHISLARKGDLFVIAPATANIIAKMAQGIADDMLSTTLLATEAPVLIAPAMNTVMWQAAATRENVRILKERGVHIITPESGTLACGEVGEGRMAEPGHIAEEVRKILALQNDLAGIRVLATAGATREKLDPVRYISNPSTGKMGYAIAEAARERGAEVTLISGPSALAIPASVELVQIETTEDLYREMLKKSPQFDIVVQAAAPSDYRFADQSEQKVKKDEKNISLVMVPNPDVAKAVGEQKTDTQVLVGFAAESENLLENAKKKLKTKNLDVVVANDITAAGAGFAADTNIAAVITADTETSYEKMSKRELADHILDAALSIFNQRRKD